MAEWTHVFTRPLPRAELAAFLRSARSIKAFEDLIKDVMETLPAGIDLAKNTADAAQETADTATALAHSIAEFVTTLVAELLSGPPQPQRADSSASGEGPPPRETGQCTPEFAAPFAPALIEFVTALVSDLTAAPQHPRTPPRGPSEDPLQQNPVANGVHEGPPLPDLAALINNKTLASTFAPFDDGSGAQAATLTNSPLAGNPTKWIPINDAGTTRHIPCW